MHSGALLAHGWLSDSAAREIMKQMVLVHKFAGNKVRGQA